MTPSETKWCFRRNNVCVIYIKKKRRQSDELLEDSHGVRGWIYDINTKHKHIEGAKSIVEERGKKKSEGSTVHCKSWQLLVLSDLLTWRTDSKCSIPSTANLLQFQSSERSLAAFSCSSHIQRLIRNCWSVCVLHACYRERGCSSAGDTVLVR